jgi:NAD(P)-dependent dehydrogenase (short-subunit alcohol dehydrogenase family)
VLVPALLQADVVVGADSGEEGDLLAAQAGNPPVPLVGNPDALLAVEATRRWSGEGIYANALNPGAIATGLQRHTGGLKTPKELHKTVPQGAATSVLLAASPLLDKAGGRYFEDCNEIAPVTRRPAGYSGVAWYAMDPANAERLWDTALGLLGA